MSLYPFVDFSYKWTMRCLTSCVWLTSLCMIFPRSPSVAATAHFIHFWAEEYAIVYMHNNFCIHTSVYEHHTCLRGWAVVYSAAVKKECTSMCACVFSYDFLQILAQRWSCLVALLFGFGETSNFLSILTVVIYIFLKCKRDSLFSRFSLGSVLCSLFDAGHWDWCEMIPGSGGGFHFSNRARRAVKNTIELKWYKNISFHQWNIDGKIIKI